MNDSQISEVEAASERALALAKAALQECDDHGFVFAAIDLSSAIDKLQAIKASAIAR